MSDTKQKLIDRQAYIMAAARALIGMVRGAEASERARSEGADLEVRVELTGGGVETWTITIERTASSH